VVHDKQTILRLRHDFNRTVQLSFYVHVGVFPAGFFSDPIVQKMIIEKIWWYITYKQ